MHFGLLLALSALVSLATRPEQVYQRGLGKISSRRSRWLRAPKNTIGHSESTTVINPDRRVKSALVSDLAHSVDRTLAGGEEKAVSMQARPELQAPSRQEVVEASTDGHSARASVARPRPAAIAQATASMLDQRTLALCKDWKGHSSSLLQGNTTMAGSDFEVPSFEAQPSWSPHLWAYAHRSCSQDGDDDCDRVFGSQLEELAGLLTSLGVDTRHQFLYSRLPDWIMNDPHWMELVQPNVKGRGYWFWKPVLLNHLLEDESAGIPDGDWVLYADGDIRAGVKTMVQRLDDIVTHNEVADVDILLHRQPFCELSWTTGDVFHRFGVQPLDPHYGRTLQYQADAYLMQVNPQTRRFVRFWADLVRDTRLLIGRNLTSPNAEDFCEHRDDQSLFSMLIKASVPSAGDVSGDCWGMFDHETTSSEEEQRFTLLSDGVRAEWAPHPVFGIPGLKVISDWWYQV